MSLISEIGKTISRLTFDITVLGWLKRDKWGFTGKSSSIDQLPNPKLMESMVAEAAYYRAGRRDFADGNDLCDWFEAEKEVLANFKE